MSGALGGILVPDNQLAVGTFVFDNTTLETPEALDGASDELQIARNVFPGGAVTHQVFGVVAASIISWRAMFSGENTLDRVAELRAIISAGQMVDLIIFDRTWQGYLIKVDLVYRHQFRTEYRCTFSVEKDINLPGLREYLDATATAAALSAKLSLHIQSLQAIIGVVQSGDYDPSLLAAAFATSLLGPVGSLITTVIGVMGSAKGIINNITSTDKGTVTVAAANVIAVATPLAASSDATVSSPASDVLMHTQNITGILSTTVAPITTIAINNPNLLRLASQYYGDQSQWTLIAQANDLSDPQPIGNFNALIIPANVS